MKPVVESVFVPGTQPSHTYVDRDEKRFETKLQRGLRTPGKVVSISGPSKSGKTVLVRSVVDEDALIKVALSGVDSVGGLWRKILDELGAPSTTEEYTEKSESISSKGRFGFSIQLPGLGGGNAETEIGETASSSSGGSNVYEVNSVSDVINYLDKREKVLLLDDFHKADEELKEDIAGAIKEMIEAEVSVCVALVPHRTDDLTNADPDLRGRVQLLEMGFWDDHELRQIANLGFDSLNVKIPCEVVETFINESAGSPQLMQQLCLLACYELEIDEKEEDLAEIDVSPQTVEVILRDAVDHTDHRTTVGMLDSGPKVRGKERNSYTLVDGEGDVYRCILKAISTDPPTLSFSYEELKTRVEEICTGGSPSGSSISRACKNMNEIMIDELSKEQPLEWDEKKGRLTIPDPYLLFHLRWSEQLG